MSRIGGPRYDSLRIQGGLPSARLEELMDKASQIDRRIAFYEAQAKTLEEAFYQVLETLDKPFAQEMLIKRNIECMNMEQLASDFGYTLRHVTRLYQLAEAMFYEKIKYFE